VAVWAREGDGVGEVNAIHVALHMAQLFGDIGTMEAAVHPGTFGNQPCPVAFHRDVLNTCKQDVLSVRTIPFSLHNT
jgi:hypothetical protein